MFTDTSFDDDTRISCERKSRLCAIFAAVFFFANFRIFFYDLDESTRIADWLFCDVTMSGIEDVSKHVFWNYNKSYQRLCCLFGHQIWRDCVNFFLQVDNQCRCFLRIVSVLMDDIAAIIVATIILKNIPLLIYQVKKKQQQKQILAF